MLSAARFCAPIFLATLLACTTAAEFDQTTQALIDSEVSGKTEDSSILYIQGKLQSGQYAACTGTVVSDHLILTARHCVCDGDDLVAPSKLSLFAGATMEAAIAKGHALRIHMPTGSCSGSDASAYEKNDIALIETKEVLNLPPTELAFASDEDPHVGELVRHVGYGARNAYESTSGVRQTRQSLVASSGRFELVATSPQGGSGVVCHGDSGGPMLRKIDNIEVLVGVASRGKKGCIGDAYFSRVSAWRTFLLERISSVETSATQTTKPQAVGSGVRQYLADDGCHATSQIAQNTWQVAFCLLIFAWVRKRIHQTFRS